MDNEQQLCGATTDIDWQTTFECELAPGHAGDHEATHAWSNEPIGPQLPPAPNRFLPDSWGEQLLSAASWPATAYPHVPGRDEI